MPVLFSSRKLSASFPRRSVVMVSEGVVDRLNLLRLSLVLEFGQNGKWSNRTDISFTNDLVAYKKALDHYQDEILEQINMLEELKRWAVKRPVEKFCEVLCQDKPLLFHGTLKGDVLIIQIFGEGLHDLEIRGDLHNHNPTNSLVARLDEMASAMRDHLHSIEAIPMSVLVKPELALEE